MAQSLDEVRRQLRERLPKLRPYGAQDTRRMVVPCLSDCDPAGWQMAISIARSVAFNAIVFVLVTGIAWRHLPRELGCSGVTAWRRLRDWQTAGVWQRVHAALLDRLNAAGAIDWSASVVDGSHIRALQGGLDRAVAR